jgi:hypothetical protein
MSTRTFEAGSPVEAGDMVVMGPDGTVHASPRRHEWIPSFPGYRCVHCGQRVRAGVFRSATEAFEYLGTIPPCPALCSL